MKILKVVIALKELSLIQALFVYFHKKYNFQKKYYELSYGFFYLINVYLYLFFPSLKKFMLYFLGHIAV